MPKKYRISTEISNSGKRKRRNTKENLLREIFLPEGNIAFLDAEFNAGLVPSTGKKISEIISLGLVICDKNYEEKEQYYSLVTPITRKTVFPVITEMTGITTAMLKNQPGFAEVSQRVTELIRLYNVKKIYTWGAADKCSLLNERKEYSDQKCPGYEQARYWNYIELCSDISGVISSEMLGISGGLSINMENLMFTCEIDKKQEHNALSDALYLYQSLRYLRQHYPIDSQDIDFLAKRELVNEYYQERSLYNSFRRFKSTSKGGDLYNKWNCVNREEDIRLRALEDDIRYLKGDIARDQEFESIQDFFKYHSQIRG